MPKSSIQFGAVFVPRRNRSRLATAFWLIEHTLAGAGVLAADWPGYVKLIGWLVVAAGLWSGRPRRCGCILVSATGEWSLPDRSLYGMKLLPGTRFTRWWALLRFAAPARRCCALAIWRDMLSPRDWRALQIRLREHVAGGDDSAVAQIPRA